MATRMQQRRGTASQWTGANPILNAGEIGFESDTNKFKIGDGTNHWADLSYFADVDTLGTALSGSYLEITDIGIAGGVAGLDGSKNLLVTGASIIVEGATNNAFETTLTVTDPTADRTITFPDADGKVVLSDNSGNVTVSGNLTVQGTTTTVDSTTINVVNSFTFEGSTADAYETTLTVTDPTADRTITLPDASGTVVLTTTLDEMAQDAVNTALTAGTGITKTYDDAGNTITLAVDTSVIATKAELAEVSQDSINDALVAGVGLDKTYNDSANTITLDIDSTVVTKDGTQTLTNKTLTSPVINTPTGITKSDVGLGNVDNTSDANKPVSTATQTALDAKAPLASPTFTGTVTLPSGTVTSGMIANGTIVDEDISSSAAIDKTKISGTAITAGDTGTVTSTMIADGTIVNGDINASAAIALSKLATDPLARANHTGTQTASTISDFDTQVRTSKVTDLTAPTGSFSMNSQKITNLGTPSADADAATKAYVDAATAGLNVHASVKAATTGNINLANQLENNDVLDGVTLSTGNRVLVKNQNTSADNGIYVVQSNGAAVRATDYNSVPNIDAGDFIYVESGTVNAKTGWVQTENITTLGTDSILFTQFSGAGTYLAGTGLTLTGNTFSINTGTTVDLNTAQTLTNKTLTSPTITGTGAIAGTFTGNLTGNVTGDVTGNAGTVTNGVYTTDTGTVTSTMIADGTIVNADINASAAIAQSKISGLTSDLAAKAPLASPTFTGTVTIPTGAALGTPASATLTNATGLPISTGVSGLGTGVATFLATPSSANLAAAVTDETGTGALVFANSPTLVTPALGTPSSATLTNATGLPVSTGISGLGTGVATALAVNVGSAGAPVVNGGALGTPSSGTLTNATGLPLTTGVTGTLPIANGGTGQTTASAAANALLPSQTSNSGKYLTTDGAGTLSWGTVSGYSAPTIGSTSIASGATVTTIAGLTLTAPTLTGTVTASGDINLTATNGAGSLADRLALTMMGAL